MQQSRMAALEERHARLDERIVAEARRPGSDGLDVARMKREKLALKEEIAGISA